MMIDIRTKMEEKGYRLLDNLNDWNGVLSKTRYVPYGYLYNTIKYYQAWMTCNYEEIVDVSHFIKLGKEVVGVWTLQVRFKNNKYYIGSNYTGIVEPLFISSISKNTKRKLLNECITLLSYITDVLNIKELLFVTENDKNGNKLWHSILMEKGCELSGIEHILYTDTTLKLEDIWGNIRRRYKTYINNAKEIWKTQICDVYDLSAFTKYKEFHHKIAGRITRNDETWEQQINALINKQAFLIFVFDKSDKLVGASFFFKTKDEAMYLSGAYDRKQFHLPVSHIVQYLAIEYCNKIGLKNYRIGERFYNSGYYKPSNKELTISEFKEGFATNVYTEFYLKLNIHNTRE